MIFPRSACIDALYTELPFEERLAAAGADGFEYVEFWGWRDKPIDLLPSLMEAAGVKICGFNGDSVFSLIDPKQQQEYLDDLEGSMQVARKLGVPSLTIHSNGLGEGGRVLHSYPELSETVKTTQMFQMLQRCAELAECYDLQLNLEALNIHQDHVGNFLVYTQTAAELCQRVGSKRLKLLYDVYHMQWNEGHLCETIRTYASWMGHVHVADCPGRHEPGTGEIYYPRIHRALEEIGYQGIVGYELFPKTTTREAVRAIFEIV